MKKRMFLSTILMTLVLLVAVTTATFAWYTASSSVAAKQTQDQMNSITAASNEYGVSGNVTFALQFGGTDYNSTPTESYNSKVLSNRFGKTYYYVGSVKTEDTSSTIASKVGTGTVTITTAATQQQLQALANGATVKYQIKLVAGGQMVVDTTTTSAAGVDHDDNEQITDASGDAFAAGVLGKQTANTVVLGWIQVLADGTLGYSAEQDGDFTAFSGSTGHAFTFYYGIHAAATSAESNETILAYSNSLTAKVATAAGIDLDPAA